MQKKEAKINKNKCRKQYKKKRNGKELKKV